MKIALVTGASRGIGRGVAQILHDAKYKVYATGRHIEEASLPSGVVRIACDHLHDEQTISVFKQIKAEQKPLGILVNNAWGGYERMMENGRFTWNQPFWLQPMHRWTSMIDGGVRAAFVNSQQAAPSMIADKTGLIVNISFWAAQKYIGNAIYGIAKAATDKLTADMAHELKPHGVTVVSLYPGLVRTESVIEAARAGVFDLSNSESPEFIGKVIAALAADPNRIARTGKIVIAAALAREYGVVDIDGKQPTPLNLQSV